MWYDDIKNDLNKFLDDGTIYIVNEQGTSEQGRLVKEHDNGICDIIIEYPFGDATTKAKRIPAEKYGDDWFELIEGVETMLKITYSKKFDKIVKSELKELNINIGAEQIENNKSILEVEKYPSKSEKLKYKTDWESL